MAPRISMPKPHTPQMLQMSLTQSTTPWPRSRRQLSHWKAPAMGPRKASLGSALLDPKVSAILQVRCLDLAAAIASTPRLRSAAGKKPTILHHHQRGNHHEGRRHDHQNTHAALSSNLRKQLIAEETVGVDGVFLRVKGDSRLLHQLAQLSAGREPMAGRPLPHDRCKVGGHLVPGHRRAGQLNLGVHTSAHGLHCVHDHALLLRADAALAHGRRHLHHGEGQGRAELDPACIGS
mmetsp:Transcript_84734/g.273898  ORF Transcript_84734/g.273898 Transcript_84734/m.273898 type:complete len:235 (-) Transcript_84734:1439-2143(-)